MKRSQLSGGEVSKAIFSLGLVLLISLFSPAVPATEEPSFVIVERLGSPPHAAARQLMRVIAALTPGHNGAFLDYAGGESPW